MGSNITLCATRRPAALRRRAWGTAPPGCLLECIRDLQEFGLAARQPGEAHAERLRRGVEALWERRYLGIGYHPERHNHCRVAGAGGDHRAERPGEKDGIQPLGTDHRVE